MNFLNFWAPTLTESLNLFWRMPVLTRNLSREEVCLWKDILDSFICSQQKQLSFPGCSNWFLFFIYCFEVKQVIDENPFNLRLQIFLPHSKNASTSAKKKQTTKAWSVMFLQMFNLCLLKLFMTAAPHGLCCHCSGFGMLEPAVAASAQMKVEAM